MKKIIVPLFSLLTSFCGLMAQPTITLKFTGHDIYGNYARLSQVRITNHTKGWQETLTWPDTVLVLQNSVGIREDVPSGDFELLPNIPNPFNGETDVRLRTGISGEVVMRVFDLIGKEETSFSSVCEPGDHHFRVKLNTANIYLLTAVCNGKSSSIKMVNSGTSGINSIEYINEEKTATGPSKGTVTRPFNIGDEMEYIGYCDLTNGTTVQSTPMTQNLLYSQTIPLLFQVSTNGDGYPCAETASVTDYDGNVYATVKIGNQCWMKENLRTTRYADGSLISTSTSPSTTTAYCFSPNLADSMIPMYGRLYNWAAVMHGSDGSTSNPSGVQGVCPTGWHVPSDAEWIQLKSYVCMHDDFVCSGVASYCAKALVDSIGWNESWATCAPGNGPIKNNATGLSLRPSGAFFPPEIVTYTGSTADYWTSTSVGDTGANAHARIYRILHSSPTLNNTMAFRSSALPVRCVRD